MGHFKYALSNLWFWLIIVLTCFFVENVALLSNGVPLEGFSNPVFFMITGLLVGMIIVYFFLEHHKNKMKLDWLLLSILLIVFAGSMIAIWSNPSSTTLYNEDWSESAVLTFSTLEKIRYSISVAIALTVLYMMIFVFGKGRLKSKKLIWLAYFVILTMVIACVFSFFFNSKVYQTIFVGTFSGEGAGSFFINPNIFGFGLLLGILACFMVNFYKSKWWAYLLMFFFLGVMVFTLCNTSLMIAGFAVLIYLIAKIIYAYIRHRYIKGTICLALFLTFAIVVTIVLTAGYNLNWKFVTSFLTFFKKYILVTELGTFSNRTRIWGWVWDLVKVSPLRMIFGYGYGASSKLIETYSTVQGHFIRSTHSGYFQVLLSFGFLGLTLYALAVVYSIYVLVRLFIKKQYRFSLLYLLIYLCIFVHSMMESTHLFDVSTSGTIIMLLFFLPPLYAYKQIRHPRLASEAIHNDVWQNSLSGKSVLQAVTLVIVSLIIGLGLMFLTPTAYSSPMIINIIILAICLCVTSLIFVPYLSAIWYRNSTNKRLTIRILIYGVILLALGAGSYPLFTLVFHMSNWLSLILCPLIYVVAGLIVTNLYMLIYHASPVRWAKQTIHAIFVTSGFPSLIMIILGGAFTALMGSLLSMDLLTMLVLFALDLFIYYLTFTLAPFRDRKQMSEEFNNECLYNWRRIVSKKAI